MRAFDPLVDVDNAGLILDAGLWPNFHDAEMHELSVWRGDVRPEDKVWVGPVLEATFELCALQNPYLAVLRFHDCESLGLAAFEQQSAIYDLRFELQDRGNLNNGAPLTPWISVVFEQAFGRALSLRCMRVEAVSRRTIDSPRPRLPVALEPRLLPQEYVFCSVADASSSDYAAMEPLATFREQEGLTLVLERSAAVGADLLFDSVFRCISLGVVSSLEAVGLTAAVSALLAAHGISANVIAAYHHDHILVPSGRAEHALALLADCRP